MIKVKKINIKIILKGMLLILAYMLLIPEISILIFKLLKLNLDDPIIYISLNNCVYIWTIIMIVLIYKKDLEQELTLFKKNWKENLKIGFKNWALGFLFMMITNLIIINITGNIASNEEQNRTLIDSMPILSFIFMVVFGPFIEEMLFRKPFKDGFQKKQIYCYFSAILFGSAHLIASITTYDIASNPYQLLFIIPYSGIGYFLAKSYIETNTIYTSTIFHAFHNAIAVILAMLGG